MIICPNFSNPDVAREFEELKLATSEAAAYHIWSLNNGNAIDKAPNGAESKLFLTLLLKFNGDRVKAIQAKAKVYSKSFLEWFGDWINDPANSSKVVDKNGEPLVVYHGSPERFTIFRKRVGLLEDENTVGFYFTSDKQYAGNFASYDWMSDERTRPYIFGVFLNIKNPVYSNDINRKTVKDIYSKDDTDGIIGHDTIEKFLAVNPWDYFHLSEGVEYVTRNSNQIKSATGNNGYFSRQNDDIYMMSSQESSFRNPYKIERNKTNILVLSKNASQSFEKYLEKSRHVLPKEFYDVDKNIKYVKSNNNPRSRKYDVVDLHTGEIIVQQQVLLTQELWKRLQEVKQNLEKLFESYNKKRSFAFKKGISTPSKGLFKRMAKLYLLESIRAQEDISESAINHKIIDDFVDQFNDSVWLHIITYTLNPTYGPVRGMEPYGSEVFGLTTDDFRLRFVNFSFNLTIPKQGLINEISKLLGKKLEEETFTGYINGEFYEKIKINRNLPYNILEEILKQKVEHTNITETDRIKMYAEYAKVSVEEVKKHILDLREEGTIESSAEIRYILYESPATNLVRKIQEQYTYEYKKWLKEKGISVPENLVHIIFSRDSFSGEDTPLIRLAAIMHEPFHALDILMYGSSIHQLVWNAFDKFINTKYGKLVFDEYKKANNTYSEDILPHEFLADLFSLIMMPKQLREQYGTVKSHVLGPTLEKTISDILDRPDFKSIMLAGPKTTIESFTEEQKIVLPLIKKIYNAIIRWLSKYSDFVKNNFNLYKEVENVTKYKRIDTFELYKHKEKDLDLELFKDILHFLSESMLLLAQQEVLDKSKIPLSSYFMKSLDTVNQDLKSLGEQLRKKCKGE